MIIRRQLYPNNKVPMKKNNDSGMELKPIYKKLPQTQTNSINKLLQTASAGSKVVQDVDTLLTPINNNQKMREDLQSQSAKERTERNLWRNDEVMEMLYTMQQVKALEKLNDKTVKSENVFKDIEVIMHRNGFKKKSHVQIWTKWKFLKSTYMTSKRNGVIPRMIPPQIYETIHQMVNGLNDSSNSANCSIDGDGSSVSGMVISGVEGGVSNAAVTTEEDDDSFGMAHPIFGFRLGMVKSEPADTGYETVENNESEKDPLENDASACSRSAKQVKEEQQITVQKINPEPEPPVRKVLEIPHRGRGRPPKNPPAASSTPINTPSPTAKNTQLPPLRVAPFAKTVNSANAIAANRPPPPLTMPPTPRIRIANLSDLKNADPVKFAQPKLMPKPTHQQQQPAPTQALRLPKEITLQTRATSTPSPSYPKMKQIPMRKTPYSLRPDRAIPDLEASLSPPPPSSATEKSANKKFEEVASTKHLVMQSDSNHMPNNGYRKRRSEWQHSSIPNKQGKYSPNDREDDSFKPDHQEDGKHYSRVLQNVIIDLSSSLRKMQTQMMRDFFNKQNELLEREHKFQLQQDQMIMKAFQEQTQEIMHSVKDLVGSIKHSRDEQLNVRYEDLREVKSNTPTRIHAMEENLMLPGGHEDNTEASEDGEQLEQEEEQDEDEEDQQIVDENDGVYTYNEEEQQNQIEQHNGNQREDHEQEEEMNNSNACEDDTEQHDGEVDNQSQSDDNHHENGLSEQNDFDSNDSDIADHDHVPLHIVSSELKDN
ncbi:hypothetical protein DOY81_005679 [Sarcophaga bullata]|nr:hypothetical protein DOY81_005679 [Sarcophaga bullata]